MKKHLFMLVIAMNLVTACTLISGKDEISEIGALQTQVALLSTPSSSPIPETNYEATIEALQAQMVSPVTVTPTVLVLSPTVFTLQSQEDEGVFVNMLADALQDLNWETESIGERSLMVTGPSGERLLLEYVYDTPDISRITILSLWTGKGESNLTFDALQEINRINDEQNFAKVAIDSDGDVWLETIYPFGNKLDIEHFVNYLEWYEETEDLVVSTFLSDFVK